MISGAQVKSVTTSLYDVSADWYVELHIDTEAPPSPNSQSAGWDDVTASRMG